MRPDTPVSVGRLGYGLATLAAIISGVSVYVNSLGVQSVADPILYTTLKDGVVGLALLVPLAASRRRRAEYRRLDRRTACWLVALALTGGSAPFAFFYTGLQTTTAATAALLNHFQFVLVAGFAAIFLRETIRPAMWTGLAVLLLGTLLGTNLRALAWNAGAWLVAVSTVLFAIDFVIAKHLLRELSTLTVMTARMTLGTGMLLVYVMASGRLDQVARLGPTQWQFVVLTGVILLAFTTTTFTAIRLASVSAVMAVGAAAPVVTTVLQVGIGQLNLSVPDVAGLAVTLLAVVAVVILGVRRATARSG
ncbi:MAG TPA: EamA family transporter [Chloroflexota bacterium]|nr:EamA family transporter [Chloroflexota bacterium]